MMDTIDTKRVGTMSKEVGKSVKKRGYKWKALCEYLRRIRCRRDKRASEESSLDRQLAQRLSLTRTPKAGLP